MKKSEIRSKIKAKFGEVWEIGNSTILPLRIQSVLDENGIELSKTYTYCRKYSHIENTMEDIISKGKEMAKECDLKITVLANDSFLTIRFEK